MDKCNVVCAMTNRGGAVSSMTFIAPSHFFSGDRDGVIALWQLSV